MLQKAVLACERLISRNDRTGVLHVLIDLKIVMLLRIATLHNAKVALLLDFYANMPFLLWRVLLSGVECSPLVFSLVRLRASDP